MKVRLCFSALALVAAALAWPGQEMRASNHREAPITALDHKADITDVFAFVSYDDAQQPGETPESVTLIMCVDPLLEPANGPTLFPFDPNILYELRVDNDHDARPDVVFEFRFRTEFQLPDVFTSVAGFGDSGANDPITGQLVVPPQIRDFNSVGLNLRQTYSVTMKRGGQTIPLMNATGPMYALPANVGPRTIDYRGLFDQAKFELGNGIRSFAGTVDDPFFIDLGAAFDTINFRTLGSGIPGVLTPFEDGAPTNFSSDTISGYAVNAIALEVPIGLLTSTGQVEPATSSAATLGIWGTTSRRRITIRRDQGDVNFGSWRQIQRLGNPLINELIIGIGSKDSFSMSSPENDSQFAGFFLDPPIARIAAALYGGALTIPPAPRNDLLPLVQYLAPIAAAGTPTGPVADMLRLNTGVSATPPGQASRLGLLAGDGAGYPNGRRLIDDVVDITLRVGVGGVLDPAFNVAPNNALGDGVNLNDTRLRTTFPYLGNCPSGRNRRHVDPGESLGGPIR